MDGFMHLFGKYFLNKTAFSTSGLKCHGKDLYKSPDTPRNHFALSKSTFLPWYRQRRLYNHDPLP